MRKLIIFLLALGLSSNIFAQMPAFSIGPKIGYNTTKLSTDASTFTSELNSNFQFGAFVRLGNKVYIQPEVNYVTKGGILQSSGISGKQEITLKTLTIPLLLGIQIIDLKFASIHLVGGPVASYNLNEEISISDPFSTWPLQSKEDIKDASWALQAGAGIDLLIFTLDVRYEIGMSELSNISTFSLKNNLLNVSLGLKLF